MKRSTTLSLIIFVICLLITVFLFLAVFFHRSQENKKRLELIAFIGKSSSKIVSNEQCGSSHELYQQSNFSILGKYNRAAVAVDSGECSKIGKSILLKGGKAVDAGIAASLCNGVLNAHSMGIGGGCVFLIYSKKRGKAYEIIARETAPLAINQRIYSRKANQTFIDPLSIGTPGELLAYRHAYEQFGGGVPWSTLFSPTIDLCENGFRVSLPLGSAIEKNKDLILNDTQLREIFVKNSSKNELYREGDTMKRMKLARTLRQIAEQGTDIFYHGDLATKVVQEIQSRGGILSKDDLQQYRVDVREALSINLTDSLKVFTSSAPTSGPILLLILNILHGYKFNTSDLNVSREASLFYHRLIESFKFAFAQRMELADPLRIDIEQLVANWTSKDFAENIRKKINDQQTYSKEYYGKSLHRLQSSGGTAHLSIVDEEGDGLAITSSINSYFGSLVVGQETGIIYNNQLEDFALIDQDEPMKSKKNLLQPGKRPISSECPLILLDSEKILRQILGASGAAKILTSVAQVSLTNLLFGKNIQESIDLPRLHHHLDPNEILFEQPFDQNILAELVRRGHQLKCIGYGGSVVQGIEWRPIEKQYWAYADRRKGGVPHGY